MLTSALTHPGFELLHGYMPDLFQSLPALPQLAHYNQVLTDCPVITAGNKALHCIPSTQDWQRPTTWQECYESRIYLIGEMQQRPIWHDFFNFMSWIIWPQAKTALNAAIVEEYQQTQCFNARNARQNTMALLDECGAIFVSDCPTITDNLRDFNWIELFASPERLLKHTKLFIFGHAIFEKLLNPYLGLTVKTVILPVESDFLTKGSAQQVSSIDAQLAQRISDKTLHVTRQLHPFPLLGWPNWHPDQDDEFYRNTEYFRPKPARSYKTN